MTTLSKNVSWILFVILALLIAMFAIGGLENNVPPFGVIIMAVGALILIPPVRQFFGPLKNFFIVLIASIVLTVTGVKVHVDAAYGPEAKAKGVNSTTDYLKVKRLGVTDPAKLAQAIEEEKQRKLAEKKAEEEKEASRPNKPDFLSRFLAGISKKEFIEKINNEVPTFLCNKAFIKDCFSQVSKSDCRLFMFDAVEECSNQVYSDYPERLNLKQSKELGQKVGQCAGTSFQLEFDKNPEVTNDCILQKMKYEEIFGE